MPQGRAFIDESPPGAWRAALAPDAFCAACGQVTCPCPDALYAGVVPASSVRTSHSPSNSAEAQQDHVR